jgi:type II secretory pathway pseudopilin PulG
MTTGTERDVLIGVGGLLVVLTLVSFGSIGLLQRMSPALERALRANVTSQDAAQEMLAQAALARGAADARVRQRFAAALARARRNVTEPEEPEVLAAIERDWVAGLNGDRAKLAATVRSLQRLGDVNRAAMARASTRAKRMGAAGAWTMVVLALFGAGASIRLVRRLRRLVILPFAELGDVIRRAGRGDRYRRVRSMEAPSDLVRAMDGLNRLLDRLWELDPGPDGTYPVFRESLLRKLLEDREAPTVAVDRHGTVVAANGRASALLASADKDRIQELLHGVATVGRAPGLGRVEPVPGADLWLCALERG